ncbi:hypothetical protein EM595_0875 [Duffyella gerundensis]|uniref:Uncharacterized protein n=1 Tax=Duffyella gerundensis TaxID=1619313 RepID=A0A0U5L3P6_9GAMM|nr:hypothetical protein EM595_0875 [Duffyella gerundensis]
MIPGRERGGFLWPERPEDFAWRQALRSTSLRSTAILFCLAGWLFKGQVNGYFVLPEGWLFKGQVNGDFVLPCRLAA